MKNSAKLLLEFSVILGLITLVTTYIISTVNGRVAPFIPIISEMPFSEPEASIFSMGLGISLFGSLLLTQVFYRLLKPLAENISEVYVTRNNMMRIIGSIGSICGIITVNFSWEVFPVIHGFTAFITFTSFLIWTTFTYDLLDKNGYKSEIRKYAVITAWFFYVMMAVFSVLDNLEMREMNDDFFYRMDNPPDVETKRSIYLNLTALSEWSMVFSFYLGLSTYRDFLKNEHI
ncbi:MAG: hypothetical protein BEU00_00705 [Marine Group III euryarchaeote CG-Epi3]|jgi:hypothetical protein|uniref:CWH43-like N-terminal domain-containing protein n=1 Tax=Marine Group III euryarchaeote CG-Epi3 TaxID=1888997 RepID=A0A1J5TQJ6_9ARCH|nr:MAG: hypothetical protein BEU00_00705 [Marine Group III euryarchaeote CG-Epi3]|tara:strand:+ start:5667 stop:6362 length:696 start_codon:yes stop_codon:yes gene_type:complete